MEFGSISPLSPGGFRRLLLPEVAAAMDDGVPLTILGMKEDGLACGVLAGYAEDGLFSIVSLYVCPDYRRRGGGRQLLGMLEAVLSHMLFTGEERLLYGIRIRFTATREEHEDLSRFLEAMGFQSQTENEQNIYYTTLSQVSSALSGKPAGDGTQSFASLPDGVLSIAGKEAAAADAPLPQQPLSSPELERDISTALVSAGRVQAFAAFDFSCGGHLTLASLWSGAAGPTAPALLLRAALGRALEKYPPETILAVQTTNEASARLVQVLLPDARPISRTYIRPLEF